MKRGAMRNLSKKKIKNLFSYEGSEMSRESDSSGSTCLCLDPFHPFSLGKAISITTKSVNFHKIVDYSHG